MRFCPLRGGVHDKYEILFPYVVRHVSRCDHGDFAETFNFSVFFPSALVDDLVDATFFDGIDVSAACFQKVVYNRS